MRVLLRRALAPALLALAGAGLALSACGGGGGGSSPPPPPTSAPTSVSYAQPLLLRVGQASSPVAPTLAGGTPTSFTALPSLPSGVNLHPVTGVISGTPLASAATAPYQVTAANSLGSAQADVTIQVTAALPTEMVALAAGYEAHKLHPSLAVPAKLRFAPDGRLFFNELSTGNVRVIDALGALVPTPVANLAVLGGAEQGLLGLALSPTFASDGLLYVYASVPAAGIHANRNQVVRFTLTGDVGANPTVIVDDLPTASIHNSGDLEFGADGMLYVTVGDADDPVSAQQAGLLSGRVLRYTPLGAIPADNPSAASPEFCKGLRNTYDVAFDPATGGLFGVENGPNTDDELNFIQAGKDYGWPMPPAGGPGVGIRVEHWPEVIAPTGLAFTLPDTLGGDFPSNVFVTGYVDADLRRIALSGPQLLDVDLEAPFAAWSGIGFLNKPLAITTGPAGTLFVSTFDAIYRIRKAP